LPSGWFSGTQGRCGSGLAETDKHTTPAVNIEFITIFFFKSKLSQLSGKVKSFCYGDNSAMEKQKDKAQKTVK